jgi:hypothetical protein
VLVRTLHAIDPRYPAADPAVRGEMLQARDELRAELAAEKAGAAKAPANGMRRPAGLGLPGDRMGR